jgi:aromatic ring-opening dioxygenase catalytic subunit (LigB family)
MNKDSSEKKVQIVYFSHGGGPLPILGDPSHKAMLDFMIHLPTMINRPDFILVVSAHWEENVATLLGAEKPSMFYDYYGFPAEAYTITYPAPGSPELAEKIAGVFEKNNTPIQINHERGFDHGLFIPLKLMYPEADIPSLQLSLVKGLNPAEHLTMGNILRALMHENILVVGSGFSFHNMMAFSWQGLDKPDPLNDKFQNWLIETCTGTLSQPEREKALIEWEKAPGARYCHPREEHLLPLHVCAGMAKQAGTLIFDDKILGKRSIALLWK